MISMSFGSGPLFQKPAKSTALTEKGVVRHLGLGVIISGTIHTNIIGSLRTHVIQIEMAINRVEYVQFVYQVCWV